MKYIRITENVAMSGVPKFFKGQQVRVKDSIADDLIARGHAILETGDSEAKVKESKEGKSKKERTKVSVTKSSDKSE